MKVLFAGPSLYGFDWSANPPGGDPIDCRGPAGQGDIARAVVEGATVIGLIDGRYEDVAAVWHKEILYALDQGVQVLGGASMGALRAAECADFGMVGIGAVFERYRSGALADDAAVAQLHAPEEMGYLPLTEALVNVEATIERFRKLQAVTDAEAGRLEASARALFFKERTYRRILSHAGLDDHGERGKRLAELIKRCKVDVKREDALTLLGYLSYLEPVRQAPPEDWRLHATHTWNLTHERAKKFALDNSRTDDTLAACAAFARLLHPLYGQRDALPHSDALGGEREPAAVFLQTVHRRQCQPRARHAERVAERDRPAMRIDLRGIVRKPELPHAC
jgi:hypothetical protein